MRLRCDPLSRAFSNRCVFNENAQRISVDRRPKHIEMYAFSKENELVWTRPKTLHFMGRLKEGNKIDAITSVLIFFPNHFKANKPSFFRTNCSSTDSTNSKDHA